ncbi:MAG TPA: DUF6529 family protein [Actinophytocola sp.]|nr:DUF6529 family protein [Actinophytocola sp.]
MSTSDYGRQGPEYGRPEYGQPDFTEPAFPEQGYTEQMYGADADATQPVPQHLTSPRVGWEGPGWEVEDEEEPSGNFGRVLLALGVGSLVAVGLGVYASAHDPTGAALNLAGFTDGLHAKAWLATAAFALVIVQLLSALAMWGNLPGVAGGGAVSAKLHRWSGRLALLISLPVAAHCLYALGFQTADTRVLLHSLLGCFFYGIFICKMIVLAKDDQKPWVIPVIGGLVFTGLTGLWLTSSLWFFSNNGLHL